STPPRLGACHASVAGFPSGPANGRDTACRGPSGPANIQKEKGAGSSTSARAAPIAVLANEPSDILSSVSKFSARTIARAFRRCQECAGRAAAALVVEFADILVPDAGICGDPGAQHFDAFL